MKKTLVFAMLIISILAHGQIKNNKPPANWQLADHETDGYYGISLEKAYKGSLKDKKPLKTIIVAVIDDGGYDANNPDLAGMEWTNLKEIPGNGIDDDHNGFIDDVHGWSFAGGHLIHETFEDVREYVRLRSRFEGKDTTDMHKDPLFAYWRDIVDAKDKHLREWDTDLRGTYEYIAKFKALQDFGKKVLGKDTVTEGDVLDFKIDAGTDTTVAKAYQQIYPHLKRRSEKFRKVALYTWMKDADVYAEEDREKLFDAHTVIDKNDAYYFRKQEHLDTSSDNTVKNYGSGDITPAYASYSHGLACASIICALRNNGLGINGITNSVTIMPIKQYVGGDERDKDVANAIRYAVDNGAKVINMSFGKRYSPGKALVDEAIQYAERKGVLLVAAAGNESADNDSITSYPSPVYLDHKKASNMIMVGASAPDPVLVGGFSNYGKATVDVFAPGVDLTITDLHNGLQVGSGTSYAAPVVSGLAALIWSYYPDLTYKQVKYCIESSADPITTLVIKPGSDVKVPFSSLSKTGGIISAYKAILIAQKVNKDK